MLSAVFSCVDVDRLDILIVTLKVIIGSDLISLFRLHPDFFHCFNLGLFIQLASVAKRIFVHADRVIVFFRLREGPRLGWLMLRLFQICPKIELKIELLRVSSWL